MLNFFCVPVFIPKNRFESNCYVETEEGVF